MYVGEMSSGEARRAYWHTGEILSLLDCFTLTWSINRAVARSSELALITTLYFNLF